MSGLVAKAGLCLGLVKVKSSPGSEAWEEEGRQKPVDHHASLRHDLQCTAQAGHNTCLPPHVQHEWRMSPRGLSAMASLQWGHHDVRVCGGQTGEKEKWSRLSTLKRDGTGDSRRERWSQL